MSELALFDRTIRETRTWLHEIGRAMKDTRLPVAYHALRGTLHTLRDRLTVEEAHDLAAQLPTLIRGIYFEGYHPAGKPHKYHEADFLARVSDELQAAGRVNPEVAVRAVLAVMAQHVSPGEMQQVRTMLPKDLRRFFSDSTPDPEMLSGEAHT